MLGDVYKRQAHTQQSPTKLGYAIDIEQVAMRSEVIAERGISLEEIQNGVSFVLKENNRVMKMDTNQEKNLKENIQQVLSNFHRKSPTATREKTEAQLQDLVANALQMKAEENGLDVEITINELGMLTVRHKHYGSKPSFGISTDI